MSPGFYGPQSKHYWLREGHDRRLFFKRKPKDRILKAYTPPGVDGKDHIVISTGIVDSLILKDSCLDYAFNHKIASVI